MSEAKHTPGPWVFLEDGRTETPENACEPLTICCPKADDLANVYSNDDATVNITRAEAVANAHLISAAPELLEALIALRRAELEDMDSDKDIFALREQAEAAIRKATGQ
jgi:hypothetical protein